MRTAKPAALTADRAHRGNDLTDDRIANEPVTPAKTLDDIPETLDDVGRETWRRLVSIYKDFDPPIVGDVDRDLLQSYCNAVSIYQSAEAAYHEQGVLIDGKMNPCIRIMNQQAEMMLKLGSGLCISATARAKVGLEKAKQMDDDPMARFFRERANR